MRSSSIGQRVPHRCAAGARGSTMVLRLLLLLGGLLKATEPAPRCETGQETLGKANHPKSPPSSLFPSPGDEQSKGLQLRGEGGRSCPCPLEMRGSAQLFGNLQTASDETGVVLGKCGWEGRRWCSSATEKQVCDARECNVSPSLSFKAVCSCVFLSIHGVPSR